MAKAAPKKTAKPAAKATKPGRRPAAAKTTKIVKVAAPVKKPAVVKAPVLSKDELRIQLDKALKTIATLRTKSREAVLAAKTSAAQIAELEAKVAQLEKKPAVKEKPESPVPMAAKPAKRPGRKAAVKADLNEVVELADSVSAEA
jgi:hypothetical protein